MKCEPRHKKAALRVAEGKWLDARIAAEAGVDRSTLWRWMHDPDFATLVEEHKAKLYAAILKRGIADKQLRVAALLDRHQRFAQVIELRAERSTAAIEDDTGLTPGGLPIPDADGTIPEKPKRRVPAEAATGMVVHQTKFSPSGMQIDEWVVDTGTSAEMRNLEKQVAQEMGEWTEKRDVTSNGETLTYADLSALATQSGAADTGSSSGHSEPPSD